MSYQALARKWRPREFSELVGQQHVRVALENALSQGRLHPALLFSGTRGVGKTTLARIIAKCLNCETGVTATPCGTCSSCTEIEQGRFVDLMEIDAASRTGVDDMRELLDNVPYAPARGRRKVYLIDEVHMLSKSSFNALLKTLEEPPPHVQFLFATTDPQKLPITILSRCLQFHLKRITLANISERLQEILAAESIEFDEHGVRRIARAADGSLRDALSLLDQAIVFGGGTITEQGVVSMLGTIERRDLMTLVGAIAAEDREGAWAAIDAIETQGLDFAEVLDELARLWQRLAVAQMVPAALDAEEREELAELAGRFAPEDLQVNYQIAGMARRDLDWAPDPRCGFEMAILRTFAFRPGDAPPGGGGGGGRSRASTVPNAPPAAETAPERAPAPAMADAPRAWDGRLQSLDLSGPARLLAINVRDIERDGERFTLSLDANTGAMKTDSAVRRLEEAIAERVGHPVTVQFVEVEPAAVPATAGATSAANDDVARFSNDPRVSQLIDLFDGSVCPETIRPDMKSAGDEQ